VGRCLPAEQHLAAYHHIAAEKSMEIYPFHKHDVPYEHRELQFRLLMETLNLIPLPLALSICLALGRC